MLIKKALNFHFFQILTYFSLVRKHFNEKKKIALKKLNHEIRGLKRDRAILRAEVATNKDTIAELKTMK